MRKMIFLLIGIIFLSSIIFILSIILKNYFTPLPPRPQNAEELKEKPVLLGKYIENPDFKIKGIGWFPQALNYLKEQGRMIDPAIFVSGDTGKWESNGFYTNCSVNGRDGIIIIHPINRSLGKYVQQETLLPEMKRYKLIIGVANIAGKNICPELPAASEVLSACSCSDSGIKIIIIDKSDNSTETLSEFIVDSREGWKDYKFDISRYAGKNIIIRLESFEGGPCGVCAEWSAVDYIDILEE